MDSEQYLLLPSSRPKESRKKHQSEAKNEKNFGQEESEPSAYRGDGELVATRAGVSVNIIGLVILEVLNLDFVVEGRHGVITEKCWKTMELGVVLRSDGVPRPKK